MDLLKTRIPFAKKGDPRSDEIRSRPKTKTDKMMMSNQTTASKRSKCKNCKVPCFMKDKLIAKDPEITCLFPETKAKAVRNGTAIIDWDDDVLKSNMAELMSVYQDYYKEELDKLKDIGSSKTATPKEKEKAKKDAVKMMNTFFNRIDKFKTLYEPPVEKRINVNVTTNLDKMVERIRAYKMKEAGIIIAQEEEK